MRLKISSIVCLKCCDIPRAVFGPYLPTLRPVASE
jgi:hypothetical protein